MFEQLKEAFGRLIKEISDPEVEGNWRRLHEQQVREIRNSFEEVLNGDTPVESLFTLGGRADRLIYNLPEQRQANAGAALTEFKYYASRYQMQKNSNFTSARVNRSARDEARWWEYDVLVICALHDPELESFLYGLGNFEEHVGQAGAALSGFTYFTSNLPLRNNPTESLNVVALSLDKTGMVDCATMTVECIRKFNPRVIAMTGVCAGRARMGVNIGDLIIPSGVFTYDTGKYTDSGFQKEPRWCSTGHAVMQRVKVKAVDLLREVTDDLRKAYGDAGEVALHTDIMACGSAVIDSTGLIDEIADTHRKVVGLDMESYALLRATELIDQRISGLIVKGVMDLSTAKTDTFKRRASVLAARFLIKFLASEFPAFN